MIGINKDSYSRRAYQCIKLVVALSARCPVARDHLTRTQVRWQWAVEWLKEKMDDHSATLSTAGSLSNEDSNTKNFQRTTSAQVLSLKYKWFSHYALFFGKSFLTIHIIYIILIIIHLLLFLSYL